MQSSHKYAIFVFSTSHLAIASELAVKPNFETARLIPLPPEVSSGCGMVLRTSLEDRKAVRQKLIDSDIPIEDVYELTIEGNNRIIHKIENT